MLYLYYISYGYKSIHVMTKQDLLKNPIKALKQCSEPVHLSMWFWNTLLKLILLKFLKCASPKSLFVLEIFNN